MNRRFVAAVALVVAVTAGSASAVSIKIETEPYPIDRLIRNLEAQARENPGDWDIAKRLARLHGMAYALKIDSIDVVSNHPGTTFQGREFYGDDRHVLPHRPVVEPEDDSQRRIAESHLLQALLWYERSLEASPDHPLALLGYGWCLKEAGHKEEAKRAFRTIIEQATEFEDPPSFGGFAWAYEATQYLLELLHPVWNFWEYRLRKKQLAFLE